jgi:hypothetical protein
MAGSETWLIEPETSAPVSRPPVYPGARIFEFVPDSPVAWTLERDGNVMAELLPREGGYLAMAHGEEVGGPFVTIEAAVAAVRALRTLDTPGAWRLTTSLTGAVAAFMLDEPAEGVEEVEVNGEPWKAMTTIDASGRQIRDKRFLIPVDVYPDGVDEIVLLDVSTNLPGNVEGGFLITRCGPLCDLFDPDVDREAIWVRETDDVQACLELIGCMSQEFPATKLSFFPWRQPDSIARDQTGRATPGAGFSESDISLIVSALNHFEVVWVDGKLWLDGHPAPRGLQRSLAGRPIRLFVQAVETVQIPTGSRGWQGHPVTKSVPRAFWRSGALTAATLEDSPKAWSWFAVVSPDLEVAKRVLTANFTRSNVYAYRGELPGVVLETLESKPHVGFVLNDLEAALLYADAFGAVVIAGDDATLVEASEDGSVVRAWSWNSEGADPPAVANGLPSM